VLRDRPSSNPTERLYQELAPSALAHLCKEARRTWQFFSMPPNIGIDVYPDSIDVFQILPLGPETCTVRTRVYARPGAEREERILQYLNSRINRQVGAEDKELSERVQKGLGAHGYEPGPLSAIEHCIHDFHDRVRAAIPAAATRPCAARRGSPCTRMRPALLVLRCPRREGSSALRRRGMRARRRRSPPRVRPRSAP
jgi:hypothetical protein